MLDRFHILVAKKEPNLKMFNYYISSNGGALPGKMTFLGIFSYYQVANI